VRGTIDGPGCELDTGSFWDDGREDGCGTYGETDGRGDGGVETEDFLHDAVEDGE
jgi:hypothetical protein